MTDDGRVVTAQLPEDLFLRMDEIAGRIDRTKSWIVREAVGQWLAEEQRRYELTLKAPNAIWIAVDDDEDGDFVGISPG